MRNLILLPTLTLIVSCLISVMASSSADAQTEPVNLNASSASGNVVVFDDLPNTAWIFGAIEPGNYFDFRRIVRRNNIETVVLDSPGGDVYEGLQIAAMIHDQGLSTFVPENALCASACAYLYFAGKERIAEGDLGVHQFFGEDDQGSVGSTQYTVSEIVGFLNEFDTPPMVFEYMFQGLEMYYFNDDEKLILNRQSEGSQRTFLQPNTVERFNMTFDALLQAMEEENAAEDAADTQGSGTGIIYSTYSDWYLELHCSDWSLMGSAIVEEFETPKRTSSIRFTPNDQIVLQGYWELSDSDATVEGSIQVTQGSDFEETFTMYGSIDGGELGGTLSRGLGFGDACFIYARTEYMTEDWQPLPLFEGLIPLVQAELKRLGCFSGEVNGIVGPESLDALQEFVGAIPEEMRIDGLSSPASYQSIGFLGGLRRTPAPLCAP